MTVNSLMPLATRPPVAGLNVSVSLAGSWYRIWKGVLGYRDGSVPLVRKTRASSSRSGS